MEFGVFSFLSFFCPLLGALRGHELYVANAILKWPSFLADAIRILQQREEEVLLKAVGRTKDTMAVVQNLRRLFSRLCSSCLPVCFLCPLSCLPQ